jgi:rhomboid family GlyGly-CTERM serine protease
MPFADAAPELLEFDRHALLAGDIWRLWTCHLVHYSWQQALVDGAVVLVAGLIAARAYGVRPMLAALALGAPFISIGLLLVAPDCLYYRGASGLAVMLTVMAGTALWPQAGNLARMALAVMAMSLAAKIAAEALLLTHGWSDLPPDVLVSWQAHLLGAAAGGAAAWRIKRRPR